MTLPATPEQLAAYVDAAGVALDLRIPAECRAGIAANLQRIAVMSGLVARAALPADAEPAPVFSHDRR